MKYFDKHYVHILAKNTTNNTRFLVSLVALSKNCLKSFLVKNSPCCIMLIVKMTCSYKTLVSYSSINKDIL